VVAKGEPATVDAFAVDETGRHGPFTLHFEAALDEAKSGPFFQTSFPVSLAGGETFGQLLKEGISFASQAAGPVTMKAWLTAPNDATPLLTRTEPLLVVDPNPAPIKGQIAYADFDGTLAPALQKQFGVTATPLASAPADAGVILVSSAGSPRVSWPSHPTARIGNAANTDEPGLYSQQYIGVKGGVARYTDLAHGPLTVELFFAEPQYAQAGRRIFDVALNGKTVLEKFDIAAEAGGKQRALVKKFTVDSPDGTLDISVPNVEAGQPLIAAIRITDSRGHEKRQVFRKDNYHDASGAAWQSALVSLTGFDWAGFLPTVLHRVRNGARLVLLGTDATDIAEAAKVLTQDHVMTYTGLAGYDDTPWIGHWYFCRKHWLLEGLPVDCVLDWQYQAGAPADALVMDAPGMEVVIGYGKNPGPGLGVAAAVVPVGKGQIVLLTINGMNNAAIDGDPTGFQPLTARRILYNAICR